MLIRNQNGTIDITNEAITGIVSIAVNNCYGVRGMANKNKSEGFVQLLRRDSSRKGINLEFKDDVVNIDLHIVVRHGVNMAAIGDSIIEQVKYNVERMAGITVGRINVFVDSIMTD